MYIKVDYLINNNVWRENGYCLFNVLRGQDSEIYPTDSIGNAHWLHEWTHEFETIGGFMRRWKTGVYHVYHSVRLNLPIVLSYKTFAFFF